MQNAVSWYEHANGTKGLELRNGSLCLVTGCDKSASWGVASFSSSSATSGQREVSLKFTASRGSDSVAYSWDRTSEATISVRVSLDLDPFRVKNQCPFVRGFMMSIRQPPMSKVKGLVKLSMIQGQKPAKHAPGVMGEIECSTA
jgi:hypothetical protein